VPILIASEHVCASEHIDDPPLLAGSGQFEAASVTPATRRRHAGGAGRHAGGAGVLAPATLAWPTRAATDPGGAMTDPLPPNSWSDPTVRPAHPGGPAEPSTTHVPGSYAPPEYQAGSYPVPAPPAVPSDPTYGQTAYAPPGYGPPGYGPGGYAMYPAAPPTNGLAIAAMILSIAGFGPIGAIMGHVARRQIQERGEQGDGFALAGIIVGWVTTGIWVLCCGGFFVAGLYGTWD
jgi:hypothetical protein